MTALEEINKISAAKRLKGKVIGEISQLESQIVSIQNDIAYYHTYCQLCDIYHRSDDHIDCEKLFYENGLPDINALKEESKKINLRINYLKDHLLASFIDLGKELGEDI